MNEARDLFQKLFAVNSRTELEWRMDTHRISNRQLRVLMNMTLMMVEPAARGVCRVTGRQEGDDLVLDVEAVGQFSNLKQEVQDALAGKEIGMKLTARSPQGAAGLQAKGALVVS